MAEVHADVDAREEAPESHLVDPALAHETGLVEAEALQTAIEIEARRGRSDEEQRRIRSSLSNGGERPQKLWDALARVDHSEAADDRAIANSLGGDLGNGPRGVGHDRDRPLVPGTSHVIADRRRVDDQARRLVEHEPGQRKIRRS